MTQTSAYEVVNSVGAVLLDRADPTDVCFTGRQNLGSKIGTPKRVRTFDSVADAQAFCAQHKVRNAWIIPHDQFTDAREIAIAEAAPRQLWSRL